MKRSVTYLFITLLMIGTIGVNESIHYCQGEFIGVVTNGFKYHTGRGKMMTECMNEHSHCKHCKIIYHSYRIHSTFVQGYHTNIQSPLSYKDWFHGDFPVILNILLSSEENNNETEFFYRSPYHSLKIPIVSGLRAPPVVA